MSKGTSEYESPVDIKNQLLAWEFCFCIDFDVTKQTEAL